MPRGSTQPDRPVKRRLRPEEYQRMQLEAVVDYRGGMSIREIAAKHGRSYGAVHRMLTEAKVGFRPRGGNVRGRK